MSSSAPGQARASSQAAARALLAQRDHALALEIAAAGLARHPEDEGLQALRQQALYRLMARHQLQDPFRFLIYAEMAGAKSARQPESGPGVGNEAAAAAC